MAIPLSAPADEPGGGGGGVGDPCCGQGWTFHDAYTPSGGSLLGAMTAPRIFFGGLDVTGETVLIPYRHFDGSGQDMAWGFQSVGGGDTDICVSDVNPSVWSDDRPITFVYRWTLTGGPGGSVEVGQTAIANVLRTQVARPADGSPGDTYTLKLEFGGVCEGEVAGGGGGGGLPPMPSEKETVTTTLRFYWPFVAGPVPTGRHDWLHPSSPPAWMQVINPQTVPIGFDNQLVYPEDTLTTIQVLNMVDVDLREDFLGVDLSGMEPDWLPHSEYDVPLSPSWRFMGSVVETVWNSSGADFTIPAGSQSGDILDIELSLDDSSFVPLPDLTGAMDGSHIVDSTSYRIYDTQLSLDASNLAHYLMLTSKPYGNCSDCSYHAYHGIFSPSATDRPAWAYNSGVFNQIVIYEASPLTHVSPSTPLNTSGIVRGDVLIFFYLGGIDTFGQPLVNPMHQAVALSPGGPLVWEHNGLKTKGTWGLTDISTILGLTMQIPPSTTRYRKVLRIVRCPQP